MANFFAIFGKVEESAPALIGQKPVEGTEILSGVTDAKVVKVSATTVAQVQAAVRQFTGTTNSVPVVVTEAQFKES